MEFSPSPGLGFLALCYVMLKLARFAYTYTRHSSLKKYCYGQEPWAFVTGSSDGIGFALAQELALNGFNVVIHGRNSEKLEKCRSRLSKDFPNLTFRIVVADASTVTNEVIQSIADSLGNINITVLINNVGGGSVTVLKPLIDQTSQEVDVAMNLNARFPIQLTRALLLTFIKKSSPVLIMTIGSLGADFGIPYAVPYAGSKAFNMGMSASLDVEMRSEGNQIKVIGILVGGVTETGHRTDKATFFTPGAKTMAKAALARVGCGKAVVVGYVGHAVQKSVLDALPVAVVESFMVPVMKRYRDESSKTK